jgi:phosphocarrier protein HPr
VTTPTGEIRREIRIRNKHGLHARPAAEFVKTASRFQSDIVVTKEDLEVNGKSIMGMMMLAAECGSTIVIRALGADSEQAVTELTTLVERGFGEG